MIFRNNDDMENKVKIAIFVGARPNKPKLWTLLRSLEKLKNKIIYTIIHSGQHYDEALGINFAKELGIKIDINLQITVDEYDYERLSSLIFKCGSILREIEPDYVVVMGDVNTSVSSAFVAARQGLKVIHLEAGLRSFVRSDEEINRKIITVCSTYHLATTSSAVKNLLSEGIKESNIFLVGNPMAETFLRHRKLRLKSNILKELDLAPNEYILFTVHKAMNITNISWLIKLIDKLSDKSKLVFPIHPHTQKAILRTNSNILEKTNLVITKPLSYIDLGHLLENSICVVTDSAGIQEESTIAGVRCVSVGLETARPETITYGTNHMIGFDIKSCIETVQAPIKKRKIRPKYWDTFVSKRIKEALTEILNR